jgi:hypothetical protein
MIVKTIYKSIKYSTLISTVLFLIITGIIIIGDNSYIVKQGSSNISNIFNNFNNK